MVVITISGVLAAVIGSFISGPIQGFFDQARRARLVDAAQLALLRMGRDLRGALPNSVRVSNGAIELLLTLDGERYRSEPPGSADDLLDFTAADQSFSTFAPLYPTPPVGTTYPYNVPDSPGYLAVYPLRQAGADPYETPTVLGAGITGGTMTPRGTFTVSQVTVNANQEYRITMPSPHRFTLDSPTHRVYLVSGPVSWLCDAGSLVRYDGYAAQPAQPDTVAALNGLAGATRTVVARDIQACQFQYTAGSLQRNAVAVLSLVLADANTPTERVRLMRQVHVDNTP